MKADSIISPAAICQAYFRTFYDTPYAAHIAQITHAKHHFDTFAGDAIAERLYLVPLFEARHKAIHRLLAESLDHFHTRQILDIGSGLSPEGLIFCHHYYPLTYIETDLSEVIEYKRRVLQKISNQIPVGLHLEAADALKVGALRQAVRHCRPTSPLIILTQGVLSFIPLEDKQVLARGVHALLCEFGGVWLTPDPAFHNEFRRAINLNFPTHLYLDHKNNGPENPRAREHSWSSESAADEFFSQLGCVIRKQPQLDETDLLTPRQLGLSAAVIRPLVENLKQYGKVWLMTARELPPALDYAHAG
jgi:hypothetical protein